MFDLTDRIIINYTSGARVAYRKICPSCKLDMGYRLKSKINENKSCRSCTRINYYKPSTQDVQENKNIDFTVFKICDGKRYYKSYCRQCGVYRGFNRRSRWKVLCRVCVTKDIIKTEETRIKISCVNQGIHRDDFDGFKTPIKKQERELFLKKELNIECFEKHNYTCCMCRVRGGTLNAHHLNSWHLYPDQRFLVDNLVCLCNSCHKAFHKKYGYKNNTKEQFKEFIGECNEIQRD